MAWATNPLVLQDALKCRGGLCRVGHVHYHSAAPLVFRPGALGAHCLMRAIWKARLVLGSAGLSGTVSAKGTQALQKTEVPIFHLESCLHTLPLGLICPCFPLQPPLPSESHGGHNVFLGQNKLLAGQYTEGQRTSSEDSYKLLLPRGFGLQVSTRGLSWM